MGLESANYISDLVPTWPLGTDKIRQGDDHLREIKKAIKNTFPNIDGPVTVTPAVLNALPANLSAIIAELIAHVVPMGVINAWSGSIGSIPVGWALCNGQTISGFGVTPDLRDRFIVGAGNSYAVGVTGGAASVTSGAAGGHDHGGPLRLFLLRPVFSTMGALVGILCLQYRKYRRTPTGPGCRMGVPPTTKIPLGSTRIRLLRVTRIIREPIDRTMGLESS